MKAAIKKERALRSLAQTPLLCAMLCTLYKNRNKQLPADRIELYEACCAMLIEDRDKDRNIQLIGYPTLMKREKRSLLEGFAYWLMQNNWVSVHVHKADDFFDQELKRLHQLAEDVDGKSVRRLFVERTGLLREPVDRQIDFTHRTFQEFLAAKKAMDQGDTGYLASHAHEDLWQQTVVLACAHASAQKAEELLKALLEGGDKNKERRHALHLLAMACLETVINISPELKEEIQKRLEKLVPSKNLKEAKLLASAGEYGVPYLRRTKGQNLKIAQACIRCLALIGTDSALEYLAEYANDIRRGVIDELLRSRNFCQHEDYRTVVFPTRPSRFVF